MMRPAMLGLASLVALGLVGCGGRGGTAAAPPAVVGSQPAASPTAAPSTSAPAPTTVDACALVSKKEAETLVGAKLNDAVPVKESCTYTGSPTGPTAQVEVYIGDGAKKFLDTERTLGHDLRPLPGIGDEAHIEDGAVFLYKSGLWVAIRFVRLDDPAKYRKPLEDLARVVAGRI